MTILYSHKYLASSSCPLFNILVSFFTGKGTADSVADTGVFFPFFPINTVKDINVHNHICATKLLNILPYKKTIILQVLTFDINFLKNGPNMQNFVLTNFSYMYH